MRLAPRTHNATLTQPEASVALHCRPSFHVYAPGCSDMKNNTCTGHYCSVCSEAGEGQRLSELPSWFQMTQFPCQPVCPQLDDSRTSHPLSFSIRSLPPSHPPHTMTARPLQGDSCNTGQYIYLDHPGCFSRFTGVQPYPSISPVFSCLCNISELCGCHTDTEAASPKRSHPSEVCQKSPSPGHLLKPGQETTGWLGVSDLG